MGCSMTRSGYQGLRCSFAMDSSSLGGSNPASDYISIHNVRKDKEDPDGDVEALRARGAERQKRQNQTRATETQPTRGQALNSSHGPAANATARVGARRGGRRASFRGVSLPRFGTASRKHSRRERKERERDMQRIMNASTVKPDERKVGEFQSHKRLRDYYLQIDAGAYMRPLDTSIHRHVVKSVELGVQAARIPPLQLNGAASTGWALKGTSNGSIENGGGGFNIFTRADCRDVDHEHEARHCRTKDKLKELEEMADEHERGRGGLRAVPRSERGRRRASGLSSVRRTGRRYGAEWRGAQSSNAEHLIWITGVVGGYDSTIT